MIRSLGVPIVTAFRAAAVSMGLEARVSVPLLLWSSWDSTNNFPIGTEVEFPSVRKGISSFIGPSL